MKRILCLFVVLLCLCGCKENADIIKTKYFEVSVPSSWSELYIYEIYEVDDKTYSLIFYDKDSYANSYGGHIVTISVYYENDEYDYLPNYEYLDKISNGQDTYVVILELPTDVQFDTTTQDTYKKLASTYESVIDSIKYINGYQVLTD